MTVTDKHVFFYGGFISNFAEAHFTWTAFGETHEFFCTEQAFMWAKAKTFRDEETAKAILSETSYPMTCKSLGRMVNNYDDKVWGATRFQAMFEVNLAKYQQNKPMMDELINSKYDNKCFVEASPTDRIWGIGLGIKEGVKKLDNENNWKGTNLLGQVINKVRDILIQSTRV